MPRAFLDAKIDGRATFFEWVSAGRYACQNERGTMAMATRGPLEELFFGFDLDRLLVRVDCDGPAHMALADCDMLRIGFVEPAGREFRLHHPGRTNQSVELLHRGLPVKDFTVEACGGSDRGGSRAVRRLGCGRGRADPILRRVAARRPQPRPGAAPGRRSRWLARRRISS